MAFTGHVLRESSGEDALQILEGKLEASNRSIRKTKTNVAGWYQTMDTAEYLRKHQKTGSKPMLM